MLQLLTFRILKTNTISPGNLCIPFISRLVIIYITAANSKRLITMNACFNSTCNIHISRSFSNIITGFPRTTAKSLANSMCPVINFSSSQSIDDTRITLQINIGITLNISSTSNSKQRSINSFSCWISSMRNRYNSTIN